MNTSKQQEFLVYTLRSRGLLDASQHVLDACKQTLPYGMHLGEGLLLYPRSLFRSSGYLCCIAKIAGVKQLCIFSKDKPSSAPGTIVQFDGSYGVFAPLTSGTYHEVKEHLPFMVPVSLRSRRTTLGCGDRLGLATPGHLRACEPYDIHPVLAQQSIRELTLAGRTFPEVVSDAAFMVLQEGFTRGYGADGDHIKYMDDIKKAVEAGMPMITLDLTEEMDPEPAEWSDQQIAERFSALPAECTELVLRLYADKTFNLENRSLTISETEAKRCALMYWRALDYTQEVDAYLRSQRGDAYDLEVSIDETSAPTIPNHHLFIAAELKRRGVTVNSLAPRFIGEFQKGIDYIGDLEEFERQFIVHCDIAKAYGEYKISIHSGSDKFSVYPIVGKHTDLRVHVKTAGTSWLEAAHAVSHTDPELFRLMVQRAKGYIPEALKLYHITADFSKVADDGSVSDEQLPQYLDTIESRQMIHITFGYLLHDPDIRERFFSSLNRWDEYHTSCVEKHMRRHIITLGTPSL